MKNKRLIDANALLEEHCGDCSPQQRKMCENDPVCGLAMWIVEAPTVDAVEVVHGEWACVNESENVWMCTGKDGCGNEILLLEGTPKDNGWNYCPNCGAKMDGGNEDG